VTSLLDRLQPPRLVIHPWPVIRRKRHRKYQPPLREPEATLPNEMSTPERLQHGEDWAVEPLGGFEGGPTYQEFTSPVRRLLKASAITLVEADGARKLREDHDSAYEHFSSPLAAVQAKAPPRVDGGERDPHAAILERIECSRRYTRALRYLGPELSAVAVALVIERPTIIGRTFQSVGASILPGATAPEQSGCGKGHLVTVCRELAVFYKLKRQRWSV
jgi:hypothetical protein